MMEKSFCSCFLVVLTISWIEMSMQSPTSWTDKPYAEEESNDNDDESDYEDNDGGTEGPKNFERYIASPVDDGDDDDSTCTLRTYDADKELETIRKWHDIIKIPIDEESAMRQLLVESCEDDHRDSIKEVMCTTFLRSRKHNVCVPGLTQAECVAVTMYSAEFGGYYGPGFYNSYNNASSYGIWEPYRIYTSLLYSAVKKLSAIEPVSIETKLYRGMRLKCSPPGASRIFWKSFTSTSLDEGIAMYFGTSTFFVFEGQATLVGARIRNLSIIPMEDEVLIPPFEVFDFVKADEGKFFFSSSEDQEILNSTETDDGTCSMRRTMVDYTECALNPGVESKALTASPQGGGENCPTSNLCPSMRSSIALPLLLVLVTVVSCQATLF